VSTHRTESFIRRAVTASVAALLFVGPAAFAATVSGTVVDDSGAPVAGAKVYYNNAPKIVTDRAGHTQAHGPVITSTTSTGKDGSFSLSDLPAGVYWLCAEGIQPTQIRSCDWGFDATKIDLSTAPSATNAKLQVHDGVTLTFQVNDSRNQIKDFASDAGKPAAPGNFRIFLVDGARLKPAQPVSATGNTRKYALVVPKTRALRLLLDTKLTVVNQTSGPTLPGKVGETIAISDQPLTYSLTVQ